MTAIIDNAAWAGATPLVSVLIPFYRDDPVRLLAALGAEKADGVEIVLLNDGSGDAVLSDNVSEQVKGLPLPARFIDNPRNEGRAEGRNRLAANARGQWLLFLDSDMLPDSPAFLAAYLDLIRSESPAIAFGGFSLDQAPDVRAHALHRSMALKSDCTPAPLRRAEPEKHVFTSNLLVRRDVFEAEPFDSGFSGWGWEDVEWAMRAGRRYPIAHIDNTATHLGLDTAPVIAGKYEQSAANFARVVAAHPDIVAGYPSYRAARVLKRVPFAGLWRPLFKSAALAESLPVALRALSMRFYRAALYAEVV
jgi:glycosyltransferase involved in cell wall biosynthesis